jgi:dienelactone hydrolase
MMGKIRAFTHPKAVRITVILTVCLIAFLGHSKLSNAEQNPLHVSWFTVSNEQELQRTWSQSLVFLPEQYQQKSVKLLTNPEKLRGIIQTSTNNSKLPVIVYLHSCEGLGHHREDLKRPSRLGFVVIAIDSFAREYRSLGCNEKREKFLRFFDLVTAFQKAELEYAAQKISKFSWVDRKNLFLVGSGIEGMVAAHYAGDIFTGHVLKGWGCRGPNPVFDGVLSGSKVRIFSAVSKNDPWYIKNSGFSVDCASFLTNKPGSVSIILERPAHYVSWYPKSLPALIRFLTKDMEVDVESLVSDNPMVLDSSDQMIELREKWSDQAVYRTAGEHCARHQKKHHLVAEPRDRVYSFVCE